MFILRSVLTNGLEVNTCLDVFYTLILKEKSKEEFDSRVTLWSKEDLQGVYGLVCVDDTDLIMPLYENSSYYIMTCEGQTFSNISKK
jgi:hypothetical protein